MFNVSTVNLSPDVSAASPDFGKTELGLLSGDELFALLVSLRRINELESSDADAHLFIEAPAGRYLVRTGRGKLYLYNARDTTEPYAELAPEEIVAHLDRTPTRAPFAAANEPLPVAPSASATPAPAPHRGIAISILVAGLALNGYTLYSAFYTASVNQKPAIILLTDPAELATHQHNVVGKYVTGDQPGDRVIIIFADNTVKFSEIGVARTLNNGTDAYRLGTHDNRLCLSTVESGVIDVINADTLLYYRDTYHRAGSPSAQRK
jgi:hypothetical protein